MRWLWQLFGWCNVGMGVTGVFLPVLPTTPFLLVAAWAFTRSSERAHRWLVTHPRFGPYLEAWWQYRAIPRRGKWIAVLSLFASMAIAVGAGLPVWALVLQGLLLTCVGTFLVTRPTSERIVEGSADPLPAPGSAPPERRETPSAERSPPEY
ncbi:YbaN family protein [Thiohalorhabdus methylotrophus]|uniref:YbaN family protein n=1 Tax=Thiohalorhabdus methylotrophus TaxID=3242694 RepID=A0ABV4TVE3_9GAMM